MLLLSKQMRLNQLLFLETSRITGISRGKTCSLFLSFLSIVKVKFRLITFDDVSPS